MDEKIERAVSEAAALIPRTVEQHREELAQLAEMLVEVFEGGGRLVVAGTGPLLALAQFVAQNFVFRLALDRPLLPAVVLGQDVVLQAALVRQNEQTQGLLRQWQLLRPTPQDLLLILADRGYDEGIKSLLLQAQETGCPTAAILQGAVEDHFPALPDLLVQVDAESPARFAEAALFLGNLLCELVEADLFGV